MCLDSGGDFPIDCSLDNYRDLTHFRGDLSDVLHDGKNASEEELKVSRGILSLHLCEVVGKVQAIYEQK